VLFVGRLVDGKCPRVAIEAVQNLREQYPNMRLYLFGNGYLRSELEQYVQANDLENMVELVGSVPYDQMPSVYRSGDVLLLPSRAEGMPRTVLEAMATNTSVVGSQLPQLEQLLPPGNKMVTIGDIERFSESLMEIFETHQPDGDLLINRETILKEYSWHQTVTETTAVLEQLDTRNCV